MHDVSLVKVHLILLEIHAYVGRNTHKLVHLDNGHVMKHELDFCCCCEDQIGGVKFKMMDWLSWP